MTSSSWRRSRTDRSRRSGAPRSRHGSLRRRSFAERLAEQQQALALTRQRRGGGRGTGIACERTSTRNDRRAAHRYGAGSPSLRPAPRPSPRRRRPAVASSSRAAPAERFHAALAPTGLVPGATGDATLTKTTSGWRIELDATGLPRLDGGRFYEAWLRNAPACSCRSGRSTKGLKVTLWAGVSPRISRR